MEDSPTPAISSRCSRPAPCRWPRCAACGGACRRWPPPTSWRRAWASCSISSPGSPARSGQRPASVRRRSSSGAAGSGLVCCSGPSSSTGGSRRSSSRPRRTIPSGVAAAVVALAIAGGVALQALLCASLARPVLRVGPRAHQRPQRRSAAAHERPRLVPGVGERRRRRALAVGRHAARTRCGRTGSRGGWATRSACSSSCR